VGVNLLKDPTRSAAWKSAVQTEFVLRVRKRVSQIVNEPEALSKFERRYTPNVGMVFVSEFNAKEMLEHISIWTGIKRWTEASGGDNGRTGEAGFICTKMMEELLDVYFGFQS
jgi:hypothetical protein